MTTTPRKSVKKGLRETADGTGLAPDLAAIPDKLYFKIGEVSEIAGVEPHVLRHWESEFKQHIRPQRARSKQRLFRRVDVEQILLIKKLLYVDGFTVPGARKFLAAEKKGENPVPTPVAGPAAAPVEKTAPASPNSSVLSELKSELEAIKEILEK